MDSITDSSKGAARQIRFRMDFVFEVLSLDDEKQIVTFVAKPDPRRYEWRSEGGKKYLYDKFDKLLIP